MYLHICEGLKLLIYSSSIIPKILGVWGGGEDTGLGGGERGECGGNIGGFGSENRVDI